ncbi:uncharacterized protein BDZ99DRAFT_512346 [Mytilinidion resinicola]|uniref:Aminoglycoside phosphotransferase domain-containing protein n=1 Tax=Mytilinidion resinicola TaxID=574789 RepID=A0A6A6Y4M0_9PEZI|nr:uncharacterized protein BDZ99DRAFT_512346 [Mytilinidion resinicola]KAF2802974.1 hypothetical protein BDZ99DRAFT_512346 [Mytilinidion resinicola]
MPARCGREGTTGSYNESLRLSKRRRYFNIHELCQAVARSTGQSPDDITQFTKIAEGGSYRVFQATFQDEVKVIIRLPYPSIVPRTYGIASESSSTSNQVGSKYTIMERVPGKELEDVWYTMTLQERMDVIEKIIDIEKILFAIRFPASGSLYFKDSLGDGITKVDLPPDASHREINKFCIGPLTEFLWWYQRRDGLAVNRGPYKRLLT